MSSGERFKTLADMREELGPEVYGRLFARSIRELQGSSFQYANSAARLAFIQTHMGKLYRNYVTRHPETDAPIKPMSQPTHVDIRQRDEFSADYSPLPGREERRE